MANPELGAKQVCPTCQAKFYDLNRRPARCPKCGAEFDPEEVVKVRRVRRGPADYEDEAEDQTPAKPAEDEDEDELEAAPEIDEAVDPDPVVDDEEDAEVEGGKPAPEVDVDLDDDVDLVEDDEDVPFIEEDGDDFDEEIEGIGEADDDR